MSRSMEARAEAKRREEEAEAQRLLSERHARIAKDTERAKAAVAKTPISVDTPIDAGKMLLSDSLAQGASSRFTSRPGSVVSSATPTPAQQQRHPIAKMTPAYTPTAAPRGYSLKAVEEHAEMLREAVRVIRESPRNLASPISSNNSNNNSLSSTQSSLRDSLENLLSPPHCTCMHDDDD